MPIVRRFDNYAGPLMLAEGLNAYANTYEGLRAGNAEQALQSQRANQARGMQNFQQFTQGLITAQIGYQQQELRDTRLFNQSMVMAREQSKLALDQYSNRAAIESGFWGSDTESPFQEATRVAGERGVDVGELVDMRNVNRKITELNAIAPVQTRLQLEQQDAVMRQKAMFGHQEQMYRIATPEQKAKLDQLIAQAQEISNDPKLSQADRRSMIAPIMQEQQQVYAAVRIQQPKTVEQRVKSGDAYADVDNGILWTVNADDELKVNPLRQSNKATPYEMAVEKIYKTQRGTPEREAAVAEFEQLNHDLATASRSTFWVEPNTGQLMHVTKIQDGVAISEPVDEGGDDINYDKMAVTQFFKDSATYDNMNAYQRKDPTLGMAEPKADKYRQRATEARKTFGGQPQQRGPAASQPVGAAKSQNELKAIELANEISANRAAGKRDDPEKIAEARRLREEIMKERGGAGN